MYSSLALRNSWNLTSYKNHIINNHKCKEAAKKNLRGRSIGIVQRNLRCIPSSSSRNKIPLNYRINALISYKTKRWWEETFSHLTLLFLWINKNNLIVRLPLTVYSFKIRLKNLLPNKYYTFSVTMNHRDILKVKMI